MNQRQDTGLSSHGELERDLSEALHNEDCKLSTDEEQLLTRVRQCMDFRKYSEDKVQDQVGLSSGRIKIEVSSLTFTLPSEKEHFTSPQISKDYLCQSSAS